MKNDYIYITSWVVQKMFQIAFSIMLVLGLIPTWSFAQNDTIPEILKPLQPPKKVEILQDTSHIDSINYNKTREFLEELLKQAEAEVLSEQQLEIDIGIDDIIVNETITKHGYDFYDLFYSQWQLLGWPEVEGDYIITITEKPFRLRMSQVVITLNELSVYEAFLQPRQEYIDELSKYTVSLTQAFIRNYDQIQKDLSSNDLSGSGIY